MTDPPATEYTGPYTAANGLCANGHAVNQFGRCEALNHSYISHLLDPNAFPSRSCNDWGHDERIHPEAPDA